MPSGIYQFSKGGSGSVINTPFSPAWNGDITHAPSANALYDYLITIGAGFGNTAYVRIGGNDSTAVVGNILLPFGTIGAAITALGTLTGSTLNIDAGTYVLTDAEVPFGLKPPNSKFDIFCNTGVTIQYYGTYGMYCSSASDNTGGNIYGSGKFQNFSSTASKVIDGKNDFAFNISDALGLATYSFGSLLSEPSTGTIGLFRAGNSNSQQAAIVNVLSRAYCRTGVTLTFDAGCSTVILGKGATYDAVNDIIAATNYTIQFNNPVRVQIIDTEITARGNAFGNANTKCIDINNVTNGTIKFINTAITCIQAPVGYTLINFSAVVLNMDNLLFQNCILKNRQSTLFSSNGVSFNTAANVNFDIIDTYTEKNTGGAGIITNLITKGDGLMVEPNI